MIPNKNKQTRLIESPALELSRQIVAPAKETVYQRFFCQNGLRIFFMNLKIHSMVENFLVKTTEAPAFGLRFCLSGRKKTKISSFKEEILIKPNQCDIFNFPQGKYYHQFCPDNNLKMVFIIIKPAFLFQNDLKSFMPGIINDSDNFPNDPFYFSHAITPKMHTCLHEIFNCPYNGLAAEFYIEAKAMELIAHNLNFYKPEKNNSPKGLKTIDIERMHYAAELLTQDFQNPSKFEELIKKTGTSRTKFFMDFREVHGVSPASYLRSARMEKAKKILQNENFNITEIAGHLGFSSSSHFTRTFKKYYGIPPFICKKKN